MPERSGLIASLVTAFLVLAPAARADDPVKDIIDHEVPALKDGTRIAMADLEAAILAACQRRRFEASVVSAGLITARWVHGGHSFEVSIPFNDAEHIEADFERALKRLKIAQKQARAAAR